MIGKLVSGLGNIFGGNKTDRDRKEIEPIVVKINEHFATYATLSNDELRNKTQDFIDRINLHLTEIDGRITAAKAELEQTPEDQTDERDGDPVCAELDADRQRLAAVRGRRVAGVAAAAKGWSTFTSAMAKVGKGLVE